ncbi:MAG: hypothetical protein AUH84_02065 [Thaumarchaeota archaeon 13_1_40CM_4_38_7]|nr:MAG: hypothetical protein AUH84_02065 [Thaumarchaeota archaeon 13_1_40CM_4_38_7]OLC93054.1 MAG: hypothetical protein AUI92_03785 [Thaumarchaeota archaeon 13_1_40CM_3_38_6]OLD40624.1 MAG: hypothetical protein AUI60_04000 [Thaumarchaeota archaeon 13_1_40CM_2_39_4]
MSLEITNSLKGALGELYYKEGCDQKGWAYLSVENINNGSEDGVFTFKKGFHRIRVRIPKDLHSELELVSHPTNESQENPSFVFDFLACKVGTKEHYDKIIENPQLCWAEIKTGKGDFSQNQIDILSLIKLPLAIFHIEDVLVPPQEIDIAWDIKSGKEWLEEFEDSSES